METTFTRKLIVTNILTLFSGTSIAQLLTGITMLLTARQLGPAPYGQYAATIVLATFTSIVFNLGLDTVLMKNAGRMPERLQVQFGSVLAIKVSLGVVWYLLIFFLAALLDSGSFPQSLLRLAGLLVFFEGIFTTLLTAFKASLKNQFTFFLFAGSNLIWFLLTLYLIFTNNTDVNWYMLARLFSVLLSVVVAGILAWQNFHPKPVRETGLNLLRESPPYAVSEFLSMLFARADVLIVSVALGQFAAGLYSPSISLITTFYLLNNAIYGVMLPILSFLFANNIKQAWSTSRRMIWLQAAVGAAVFLVVLLGSGFVVLLLGEKYAGSIDVIRILSVNIFLHAINFAFIAIIISTNQQPKATRVQAIAVGLNIVLNLLIVSQFGINGVAVVFVMTELFLFAGYILIIGFYRAKSSHPISIQNILLINGHTFVNAGDAALISVATSQLETAFPGSRVTCVMNDPLSHPNQSRVLESLTGWIRPGGDWNIIRLAWSLPATIIPFLSYRLFGKPWLWLTPRQIRALVIAYTEADIVVSIPGGFVYSSGRGIALLITFYSWAMALLAGKPLYILPQSIGPLHRNWECRLLRFFLTKAQLVMVRETISIEQLNKCRIKCQQALVPDLAFSLANASDEETTSWFQTIGLSLATNQPLLGITVIDWAAQNVSFKRQAEYEQAIIEVVRYFINMLHGRVIFLPQCIGPTPGEDDRIPGRRIVEQLTELSESICLVEEQPEPALLKAVCGKFDLFIGTRMHSNIFALANEVPVIAIGYLHKTQGIADMVEMSDWVLDINQIDPTQLVQKTTQIWEFREAIKSRLAIIIPDLRSKSARAGQMIAEDCSRLLPERFDG